MEQSKREAFIRSVINAALGPLADWKRPEQPSGVGHAFPEVFDRFDKEVIQLRADIQSRLSLWSDPELEAINPESEAPALNPLFDLSGSLGRLAIAIVRLKQSIPQDFVGGWVHSKVRMEATYWAPFQTYTLEQAILLSIGRDPRRSAGLAALFRTYGRSEEADEMLYFLEDRVEQVASALGFDPTDYAASVKVAEFFDLIERANIQVDPRFRRMLREARAKTPTVASALTRLPQDPTIGNGLHGSSRKAHARIITAICIAKYGLSLDGKNLNRVATAVENDTLLNGLESSLKAIRALLKEGLSQLDA